ncbi:BREX-1 system adenine-specific DNA-methyltransferase PglX [Desulfitobacterium hafniense]|uniref:BREX-1 system adenine-specific DNA-methyltransferase PglX n=1 Tax=Desulfitobacterium hafniense TaxID=49338 RepID=UPI00037C22D4|nr:BREX-1 system adenine-specific DNA-methyltransferase PglX [Desulfitobacterium hafniense]
MNKNAIQKYAIWARNELIEQVKQRAYQYGISEKGYGDENATVIAGRVLTAGERSQRQAFVGEIKKYSFKQVVEEVAYTWFNRFVALRYMEVKDYLPTHVRVFSDSSGNFKPEILTNVLHLDLPGLDKTKVSELLNANATEELYRYLLLTQCNALNTLLPEMFEPMGAYTEMLLPNNILKPESVIGRLVKDIPEEDFRDAVQIIGWLYQYYNTEPKQAVFDGLKKNIKITKENIPAATQLFTPDWIVRYMVENSLGRLWLESHPNSKLREGWKYYLDEAEQTPEVAERLRILRTENTVKSPEDIKLIDPCMGSGHILVYAFDVLIQIYTSEGYSERDAAKLILEKNLYGLEIDRRAHQLACFALMMKARQYNRRILTLGVRPQVYEPTGYAEGMEYGSLVRVGKLEPMPEQPKNQQMAMFDESYEAKLNTWNFRRLLAHKYDVVVTNPPYMGNRSMGAKITDYVVSNYPDGKIDLFAAFIERCITLTEQHRFTAMITQHSWMFLSSFEKLRTKLLTGEDIINMAHLGPRAFEEIGGEVVQTVTFVIRKSNIEDYSGSFVRLVDYPGQQEKESTFLNGSNRYIANKSVYKNIAGNPVVYWISKQALSVFQGAKPLIEYARPRVGQNTGDNDRFLRYWYEVVHTKIAFGLKHNELEVFTEKWIPYNKGGGFRRWYGNFDYVVNWENDGQEIKDYAVIRNKGKHWSRYIQNIDNLCKEGVSWSDIASTRFGCRYLPEGFICDVKGSSMFPNEGIRNYLLAFLNGKIAIGFLQMLNPTTTFQVGNIGALPLLLERTEQVSMIADRNIQRSKEDWDAFEVSWDFTHHPLICGERSVAAAFAKWEREAAERFDTLKQNEEELNRIFIDIYGLQDELTPEVEDKDVTVRRADLGREIRSLISYAVGCMFGRYSLDVEGLAYAGGEWDGDKYKTFPSDKDNIIPICDDEYFDDDIVGRFVAFIKTVYGTDTLEENLKYIADALGGKGTPREVIRNYFLNDFYKDHCKIYQKRPIYWLFDSGKKNGFKALIYMHRYSRDLLAKLRTDYVHEQQERYRTQLSHIAGALNTVTGAERARLLKQQDKLTEQVRELGVYEEKVHHLADQNISIDLDDGVKKNYGIFADVLAKI